MSVTSLDPVDKRIEALEHQLEVQNMRIKAIQDIGTALSSTLNLDTLLSLIMDKITTLMDADRSTLFLLDEDKAELWSKIAQGSEQKEIRITIGEGMAGWVARTGQTLNIKDAYKDSRFNQDVDKATGYRTTSMLCQPIRNHRRKIIGVMQVLNKHSGYFTVEDEKLLAALTSQAAISIENSKLYLNVVGKNIELLDTQERLRSRMAEIDLLYQIEKDMNRELRLDVLLDTLLRQACEAIPSSVAAVVIREPQGYRLFVYPSINKDGELEYERYMDADTPCLAAKVANTGELVMDNDVSDNDDLVSMVCTSLGLELESTLCVPVLSGDDCMGALQLINSKRQPQSVYTDGDLKLMTVLAGQVSSAVLLALAREEELNESRLSAIGQALSGVLHDLKTPMTIIGCNAQLMAEEEAESDRQSLASGIMRQLLALKSMTAEILSFARGESNLLIRKLFVSQVMNEVEEVLLQEFMGRDIELVVELEYKDEIRADEGKLKRAIYNLARNAREAMPKGGKFTVRSSHAEDNDHIKLTFTDTGDGIPSDIRHNLFESFVTSGKANGTGLGLAIVKKIVEQHGGQITYDSVVGQGTSFDLWLPRLSVRKPSS